MMQHFCNNYCKNFINYRSQQTEKFKNIIASCTMLHNLLYLGFTCDKSNAILHEDYATSRLSI